MSTDVIKFVDSIAASPTVRLDINDGTTWRTTRFEAPPPRLRRAMSSNAMRDGINVSSSQYDARTLTLGLTLVHTTEDGKATELQKLARELDRTDNFLMYQPVGNTKPVFFRLFRSDMSQLEQFTGLPSSLGKPTIELLAEPFAYGLIETLGPYTVNYDPAAGSNGLYFDVTGVIGDVEALPIVSWPVATGNKLAMSVRRRGTPANTPFVLQAESMTLVGTGTALTTYSDSSGTGNNAVDAGTLTGSLTERLSMAAYPSSASVDARGRYRVFARVHHGNGTPTTYQMKLGYTSSDNVNPTATFTLLSNAYPTITTGYVDLGLFNIPFGADPVASPDGTSILASGSPLSIRAAVVSGSQALGFDYFLFLPADDRMCIFTEGYVSGGDAVLNSDGTLWTRTSGGAAASSSTVAAGSGGPPALTPNVTNRIFVAPAAAAAGAISGTKAFTVKYHPRYLFVRPSAT